MSQPRALASAALAFVALLAPSAAHATTYKLETTAACAPAGMSNSLAIRLTATPLTPIVRGSEAQLSVQFSFAPISFGDPTFTSFGPDQVGEQPISPGTPSTLPAFSATAFVGGLAAGPVTTLHVDVPADQSGPIALTLGSFSRTWMGGSSVMGPDSADPGLVVAYSRETRTCTATTPLLVPLDSEPTPTPTPTPTPEPTSTTYSGIAGARFLGRLRGVGASKASLTLPAAPNGGSIDGSTVTVDPITAKLVANLLIPVTARIRVEQAGAASGSWSADGFALSLPARLKIASTKVLGIELVTGATCQTKTAFPLTFTAPGGQLTAATGKGTLPGITGCGSLTTTLNPLFTGAFELSLVSLKPAAPAAG